VKHVDTTVKHTDVKHVDNTVKHTDVKHVDNTVKHTDVQHDSTKKTTTTDTHKTATSGTKSTSTGTKSIQKTVAHPKTTTQTKEVKQVKNVATSGKSFPWKESTTSYDEKNKGTKAVGPAKSTSTTSKKQNGNTLIVTTITKTTTPMVDAIDKITTVTETTHFADHDECVRHVSVETSEMYWDDTYTDEYTDTTTTS